MYKMFPNLNKIVSKTKNLNKHGQKNMGGVSRTSTSQETSQLLY